jgi:hypothetical protein
VITFWVSLNIVNKASVSCDAIYKYINNILLGINCV